VRKETSLFLLRFTIDRTDKYNYQISLMTIVNMTLRNWGLRTLSEDFSDLRFLWIHLDYSDEPIVTLSVGNFSPCLGS